MTMKMNKSYTDLSEVTLTNLWFLLIKLSYLHVKTYSVGLNVSNIFSFITTKKKLICPVSDTGFLAQRQYSCFAPAFTGNTIVMSVAEEGTFLHFIEFLQPIGNTRGAVSLPAHVRCIGGWGGVTTLNFNSQRSVSIDNSMSDFQFTI